MENQVHYCKEHQTKFFKNEKTDPQGQVKVWYSHKKLDGSGFCVEKDRQVFHHEIKPVKSESSVNHGSSDMYACNAMNNAVALASNGVIEVDQIGDYFKKIYSELQKTTK